MKSVENPTAADLVILKYFIYHMGKKLFGQLLHSAHTATWGCGVLSKDTLARDQKELRS